MSVDLRIAGGRVIDGTGASERPADLVIHEGRIAEIVATGTDVAADTVVDASGLIVAPGFIDIHSHGDLVLAWPAADRLSLLEGRLAQGITSEIVGNCGLGAAPVFGHGAELLPQIGAWMSPEAYPWPWSDIDSYFAQIESLGIPSNVGTLVPHGALRLGALHLAHGDADDATLAEMSVALDEALEQGAFGLSAGLIYPPGMYTGTEELTALARRLASVDAVFTSHIRGSSETLLDAVEELIQIGRDANIRVHHSHAEAVGRSHWSKLAHFLDIEEEARRAGIRLSADMFPYAVAATMMLAIYPPWSLEGGVPRLLDRLRDEDTRRRIERDIETVAPSWPPWTEAGWPHNLVMAVGWSGIRVSSVGSSTNRDVVGLTLEELGDTRGQSPFDAVTDLIVEEDGNVGQFVLDISGEAGLRTLIECPDIAFITDANDYGKGKPHPAAYGSFPRVLSRYVREQSALSLPEAVRRMTSLPATIIGLEGRGTIERGNHADLVVFDPETVMDRATLAEPRRKATGITAVIVNGTIAYQNGQRTGALSGQALRR